MSAVLFVVPPLTGHTNPTVAVGDALRQRGHDVAWCGYGDALRPLLTDGRAVLPVAEGLPPELVRTIEEEAPGLRGPASLKFFFERFLVPLAGHMIEGVGAAVATFGPDVLVVDQQAVAGALVARRRGLRWATSATTSAELVDPFSLLPKVKAWRDELLVDLQVAHGVPAAEARADDVRLSDDLVLGFTTRALIGPDEPLPPQVRLVGPALGARPAGGDFPWSWLDPTTPTVLASLGTLNAEAGAGFYRAVVDALGPEPLQVVVVAPPALLAGVDLPGNVLVRAHVPQLALLPRVDAVISHGGHNTVCESLAHGVPLVVAPIRDDQPVVAGQVTAAGAGVRVKFGRVTPEVLRRAVRDVLDEPGYRHAAEAVAASFRAAGGAGAAADAIEGLAAGAPALVGGARGDR